jgi:hypothetical protein
MTYEFLDDLHNSFLKKQTLLLLQFSDYENLDIQLSYLWDDFINQAHDLYQLQLNDNSNYQLHLDLEVYLLNLIPIHCEDTWWYDNNTDELEM